MGACRRAVLLPETVEHVRKKRRIDPFSCVPHGDDGHRLLGSHEHLDPAPLAGELDGVGQQVPDGLLQAVGIAKQEDRTPLGGDIERNAFGLRPWADHVRRRVDDVGEIDGQHFKVQLAGDDARQIQQVFHELRLRPGVALNRAQGMLDAPGFDRLVEDHRRPPEDGVQRCPQLVRQGGKEFVFDSVRLDVRCALLQ